MKRLLLSAIFLTSLIILSAVSHAQTEPTSAQRIEAILSGTEHRDELMRLNSGIIALLADARLTDQTTRQTLQDSQVVFAEMLNQKSGSNAGKLVDLAKWLRAQEEEQEAIRDAGGAPPPQQQFVLDNALAGQEVYLTTLLSGILQAYVEVDQEAAGPAKLESLLQLYLSFRPALERSWSLVDSFLLYTPRWIQTRFPQLTPDQKRQFCEDANDARAERAAEPATDEVPLPPPTPQELAAYEAAYQFIVNNTPSP